MSGLTDQSFSARSFLLQQQLTAQRPHLTPLQPCRPWHLCSCSSHTWDFSSFLACPLFGWIPLILYDSVHQSFTSRLADIWAFPQSFHISYVYLLTLLYSGFSVHPSTILLSFSCSHSAFCSSWPVKCQMPRRCFERALNLELSTRVQTLSFPCIIPVTLISHLPCLRYTSLPTIILFTFQRKTKDQRR